MTLQGDRKRDVASGTITIVQDLTEPITIDVPVAPAKFEEGADLMEELWAVLMKHYRKSERLSPIDTIKCLTNITREWNKHERTITISKYKTFRQKVINRSQYR